MEYVLNLSTQLHFLRPITGQEVAEIVRQLVINANARKRYTFTEINIPDPDDPDRIFVGQASNCSWHHLIITDPKWDVDSLRPKKSYRELLIKSTRWASSSEVIVENEPTQKLAAILDFTDRFGSENEVRHKLARL